MNKHNNWDILIKPTTGWFDLDLKILLSYRDLIYLFVKRDFITFYKQTILGPLWYIIQPLINSIVFTVIFLVATSLAKDFVNPIIPALEEA